MFVVISIDETFESVPELNYTCLFRATADSSISISTDAKFIDIGRLECPMPDWGSLYAATTAELFVYKGETDAAANLLERIGSAVEIYFIESMLAISPSTINAAGAVVTVTGGGFDLSPSNPYFCFVFDPSPSASMSWSPSTTALYSAVPNMLQGAPFMPTSITSGECHLAWPLEATSTFLTILQVKPLLGSTMLQPVLEEISAAGVHAWRAFPFNTTESWDSVAPVLGHNEGGDTVTVSGYGFRSDDAEGAWYTCEFEKEEGGAIVVPALVLSSDRMECVTPAWSNATDEEGRAVVRVRRRDGKAVQGNSPFDHIFRFLALATWSEDTPAEGSVLVEGVHCASLDLNFSASDGLSPLRLVLEYTPMRPTDSEAFVGMETPTLDEVKQKTKAMESVVFDDAVALEQYLPGGEHILGNLSFSLQLPYSGSRGPMEKASEDGQGVGIPENDYQPSLLRLDAETECEPTKVCGRLRWDVSPGWEGYAYRLCVSARPASVSPADLAGDPRFLSTRCVFVVVPKCSKCTAPGETLYDVATFYHSSVLNLWSVNPELINTTASNPMTDEVWNSPGDLLYPLVPEGGRIRTGVPYRVRGHENVHSVARRFGLLLTTLMKLNPDVVKENQNLGMPGKLVCVLPSADKYDQCPMQAEAPTPLFYEEVVRYDARGIPHKSLNPRYPLPPRST